MHMPVTHANLQLPDYHSIIELIDLAEGTIWIIFRYGFMFSC